MTSQITRILVPTDFSKSGNHAVSFAVKLSKEFQADLHLLHVLEDPADPAVSEPGILSPEMMKEAEKNSLQKMESLYESIIMENDITVHLHMPRGVPAKEICKESEELSIDLIVMGTGHIPRQQATPLPTPIQVIKNTNRPVFAIPPAVNYQKFKNVLYAVRQEQNVCKKSGFFKPFLEKNNYSVCFAVIGQKETSGKNLNELNLAVEYLENKNLSCRIKHFPKEDHTRQVLDLSKRLQADLVVIDATPDMDLNDLYSGSSTRQNTDNTLMPVLSFHAR